MRPIRFAPAVAGLLLAFSGPALPAGDASNAAALRAKFAQVRERLDHNAFGRPLLLDSSEASGDLKGDVYAVLDHPFDRVQQGFAQAGQWCDVLTLPFNVQKCESDGKESVRILVGRKPRSPIEQASKLDFRYAPGPRASDYFAAHLSAASGPAGTRDYRIVFEATPLDERRTFVHMHYGYANGVMSKLAMQAYLSGAGAGKVGFTAEGKDEQGKPRLVGGMRGVMERNTMRYFLAIDAYLDTLAAPQEGRLRARLDKWFSATERYARQLHEMSRAEYLALKSGGGAKVAAKEG